MLQALQKIWKFIWKYKKYIIPIFRFIINYFKKQKKMKTESNLLTDAQVKQLAKLLDKAVKLKGIAEAVDGIAFKIVINLANQYGSGAIKEEYKEGLSLLITKVLNEDWDGAATESAVMLNSLVDIPGIDEDTELSLFKTVMELIVKLLKQLIDKKAE